MNILGKLLIRVSGYSFIAMLSILFIFRLIFQEMVVVEEIITTTAFFVFFISIMYFLFARTKVNLKENTLTGNVSSNIIKSDITKDELLNKLQDKKDKYLIEDGDNYIKMYSYINFKTYGEMIFISFENGEITITSRPIMFALTDYGKNAENVKMIVGLLS